MMTVAQKVDVAVHVALEALGISATGCPDLADNLNDWLSEQAPNYVTDDEDIEQPETYEVDTWFFMLVPGLDDDDGVDRHTPVGSLVYIAQTFEGEDNYSILCPANGAGFFMDAEEIRTKLMPVPIVYDSLEADEENSIMDRYTVFPAGEIEETKERYNYLGCSIGGRAVSMWGEIKDIDIYGDFDNLGRKVPVYHLDADTQRHIFSRLRDCLSS